MYLIFVVLVCQKPAVIREKDGKVENLPSNGYNVKYVLFSPDGKYVYAIGSSPVSYDVILRVEVKSGEVKILKNASSHPVDKGYLSEPQKITFPTGKDKKSFASGFLYLPKVSLFVSVLRRCFFISV